MKSPTLAYRITDLLANGLFDQRCGDLLREARQKLSDAAEILEPIKDCDPKIRVWLGEPAFTGPTDEEITLVRQIAVYVEHLRSRGAGQCELDHLCYLVTKEEWALLESYTSKMSRQYNEACGVSLPLKSMFIAGIAVRKL